MLVLDVHTLCVEDLDKLIEKGECFDVRYDTTILPWERIPEDNDTKRVSRDT